MTFLEIINSWNPVIAMLATVILVFLTYRNVRVAKEIFERQSDPCVVVSLATDRERPMLLLIKIENIGTGIAYDVRFDPSKPIPQDAFSDGEFKPMNSGPLIDGIPALAPGEVRLINWATYKGALAFLGDAGMTITCEFKKLDREMKPIKCPIDAKSFANNDASQTSLSRIVSALEKIQEDIRHITIGFKQPVIRVMSMKEAEKREKQETKELRAFLEENRERQPDKS